VFPEGRVLCHASEVSEAAVRHAHTLGAREVWGEGPLTPESWHRRWQQYRREWSFAVLDPSEGPEAVVGYLLSLPQVEVLSPARRTEGAIHRLTVIPSHRRRGVGRALATTALRAFAESGLRFGSIIVDPENTNSGFALYDDLGFAPTTRAIVYAVNL
jgi:ribosomal protein S18 acetylase RimI-like enzyme